MSAQALVAQILAGSTTKMVPRPAQACALAEQTTACRLFLVLPAVALQLQGI